jgi:hypothetical protein
VHPGAHNWVPDDINVGWNMHGAERSQKDLRSESTYTYGVELKNGTVNFVSTVNTNGTDVRRSQTIDCIPASLLLNKLF